MYGFSGIEVQLKFNISAAAIGCTVVKAINKTDKLEL